MADQAERPPCANCDLHQQYFPEHTITPKDEGIQETLQTQPGLQGAKTLQIRIEKTSLDHSWAYKQL